MTAGEHVGTVVAALEEANRLAEDARSKVGSEIADVDREMASLDEAIAKLHEQREALVRLQEELELKATAGAEVAQVYYDAIFGALSSQAAALSARADVVQAAAAAQQAALAAAMNTPEIAALKAESEQFKTTVEPTLAGLPESYRDVLVAHHQSIEARLAAHLAELDVGSVDVDEEPLAASVVFAVDPIDGEPEVLTVVFPIYEAVYADWESRPEDLCTRLASCIVQGIYSACREAGLADAEGMFGGHQDLLAMELDLAGASGDVATLVANAVNMAVAEQPEFADAKVELQMVGVDMDHLLPPDEGDEDDDAGES